MKQLLKCLLIAAALFPCLLGAQQAAYPSKPVTIVVPFSPGASNDMIARFLGDRLGKLWKQTVVVENRPGAGSSIGSSHVAKSPPDGYTLLIGSSSYTTNAASRSDQGFDPLKDLKAISMIGRGTIDVVSGPRVPMSSLADLAREAKSRPIFYGTSGVGSSHHFNAELLADAMGIQMTPVPYKGGNEALLDLGAGRIDIVVGGSGGSRPHVESGKVKSIAVLSKNRMPTQPNVLTSTEQGYPAATTENYWAIFVPSATPEAVIKKISDGVKAVINTPDGRQFLAKVDAELPEDMSPQEVTALVHKEIAYWTKLGKRLNLSDGPR